MLGDLGRVCSPLPSCFAVFQRKFQLFSAVFRMFSISLQPISCWLRGFFAFCSSFQFIFMFSIKLSGEAKEYIYTLTEDAAPAGFEIANSVQFKLETVDDGISLFVRENVDAEWVRADKRLIQMIDETTPREDTPTPTPAPTPQPTPAAIPVPTPAPTPVIAPRKVQTLPQTGDGFPLLAIVVVSLASATGIVLLTVKQRNALKETSDKEDADESSDR